MPPWVCSRCIRASQTRLKSCQGTKHAGDRRVRRLSYSNRSSYPSYLGETYFRRQPGRDIIQQRARFSSPRYHSQGRDGRRPPSDSSAYAGLPLPPFLRNQGKPANHDRYPERFSYLPYTGDFKRSNEKTRKQKFKAAPFATVFAENPYAQALAGPVRECTITSMRLPRACMLDFHLAEVPGSDTGEVQLLPLSLAAALVPQAKRRSERESMTMGEEEVVNRWRAEDGDRVPIGSASYMLAKREAVEFVSQNPKSRLTRYAVARRVLMNLDKYGKNVRLKWREDMPQLLLLGMRKVLARSLAHFARQKASADAEGAIQAMPGRAGLERLDDVNDVQCVLRLRRSGISDDGKDTSANVEETRNSRTNMQDSANESAHVGEIQPTQAALEHSPAKEQVDTSSTSLPDAEHGNQFATSVEHLAGEQSPEGFIGSTTQVIAEGPWEHAERKSLPFLEGIRPLPSLPKPATIYYPTVRYRNRRVAAYNLPHLLGDEMTANIFKGTVFEDLTYVTLTMSRSLRDTQIMLLKLHAYQGESKAKTAKV